jgi:hypothetical protein
MIYRLFLNLLSSNALSLIFCVKVLSSYKDKSLPIFYVSKIDKYILIALVYYV